MTEIKKETTHYIDSHGRHVGMKETIDIRSHPPKRFYRRFEFWLIVAACVVATVLLGLGGCGDASERGAQPGNPEPSSVLRSFVEHGVRITEFRDSAGRICVLAGFAQFDSRGGAALALDCGIPLPVLDYERLPEPSITPFPEPETSGEKRPL